MKTAKLLRYDDPTMGPRRIPNLHDPENGKTVLKGGQTFKVDLKKQTVILQDNGSTIELGSQMIYMVVWKLT